MLAGAPRPLVEHVREADWTPDGADLAVVHRVGSRERLEVPIGKVFYETDGNISHIRFHVTDSASRSPIIPCTATTMETSPPSIARAPGPHWPPAFKHCAVCWSPDDQEVWSPPRRPRCTRASRWASSLSGRTRTILALPTDWRIRDVTNDGRALTSGAVVMRQVGLWIAGETQPRDLTMFDQSLAGAVSQDGQSMLIVDQGSFAGTTYASYLRRVDRPEPVRLGDGQAVDFCGTEVLATCGIFRVHSK
jgi:hypothetical protein